MFQPPNGMNEVRQVYGSFKYTDMSGGNIDIDDTWERDNLVRLRNVCGTMFNLTIHRLVAPVFEQSFRAAMIAAPGYQIKQIGCFCPRHKMHDPKRGLSIHSWAAAVDFNWDTNGVGQKAPHDLPAPFVKAFTDGGWDWGGDWQMRDWMHFQLAKGV
jgi:hypothetical protein